jgi:hypothetical protein
MAVETADFGSTNLDNAEYDTDTETLTINFYSGGTYEYSSVPQAVWEGLRKAGSAGRYFHRVIKPRFSGSQV